MGESEAYYRIFRDLHLTDSNLKVNFLATGFPENRSKFLSKVHQPEGQEPKPGGLKIPGLEGTFEEKLSIHEKYAARPNALEDMTLAQFCTHFDYLRSDSTNKIKFDEDGCYYNATNQYIINWKVTQKELPRYIKLKENLGYMQLRQTPSILRLYKFRPDTDCHEFMYSNLLLYRPWRDEEELYPKDLQECKAIFNTLDCDELTKPVEQRQTKVQKTEANLFPFRKQVLQAKEMVEAMEDNRSVVSDLVLLLISIILLSSFGTFNFWNFQVLELSSFGTFKYWKFQVLLF